MISSRGYAAQNNKTPLAPFSFERIEEAFDRTVKANVKYRFVIDMSTL